MSSTTETPKARIPGYISFSKYIFKLKSSRSISAYVAQVGTHMKASDDSEPEILDRSERKYKHATGAVAAVSRRASAHCTTYLR